MATKYVNSGAGGANNGTSWTDAWTSLASSNGVGAGDDVRVHKTHSETGLTTNINWSSGTISNPVRIVCVDKDASDALSTGAIVSWSTTTRGPQGNIYAYGMDWRGAGAVLLLFPPVNGKQVHEQCTLRLSGATSISLGDSTSNNSEIVFINTNLDFTSASTASVTLQLTTAINFSFRWYGGTYTCRSTQANLFTIGTNYPTKYYVAGVTFSGTVTNLFSTSATARGRFEFVGCVAPAYATIFSTYPTGMDGLFFEGDGLRAGTLSAALLMPVKRASTTGSMGCDTARYRTGGADDGSQSNEYSWEVITLSVTGNFFFPYSLPPITRWVDSGSQTVTVYVASGVTLQDDEFWIEVISPSEAGTPTGLAAFRHTRTAVLATPAALTTDSGSTWTGSGVGTMQKIDVAIAPTVAGVVNVRCHLAKPSTTVYIDPKLEVA